MKKTPSELVTEKLKAGGVKDARVYLYVIAEGLGFSPEDAAAEWIDDCFDPDDRNLAKEVDDTIAACSKNNAAKRQTENDSQSEESDMSESDFLSTLRLLESETDIEKEHPTKKFIVEMTGYRRHRKLQTIEVPARWTIHDIKRLCADDLDDGIGDWEAAEDEEVRLDEDIKILRRAPDDAQVDAVLSEPPSSGLDHQLRLRRRLLKQIASHLTARVIDEAADELRGLAKVTLSIPEEKECKVEDLLREFERRKYIEPRIKGDPAPVIRDQFAEWLAEGVRYDIDFSVGEDGAAIAQPIEGQPTMAEWLDEWTGMFFSAGGWARYDEYVESDAGPEFVAAIRRGEIEGPSPHELESAMEKVQAERKLIEKLKAEANLPYDSSLHRCIDIDRNVVYGDHFELTEEEEQEDGNIPKWELNLFWASKMDRNKLYGFRHRIFHGQDIIRMQEGWAVEEYAGHYLREHLNWERYSFVTGTQSSSDAAYSEDCNARFEQVAEVLGEKRRQHVVRQIDEEMLREHGDVWHAFKACKPETFSTPHDPSALVRLAKEIPEDKWEEATNYYGVEYLQALRDALEASEGSVENE